MQLLKPIKTWFIKGNRENEKAWNVMINNLDHPILGRKARSILNDLIMEIAQCFNQQEPQQKADQFMISVLNFKRSHQM